MPMPLSVIGQRLGRLVGGDGDGEFGIAGDEVGPGDRLIAQLVEASAALEMSSRRKTSRSE